MSDEQNNPAADETPLDDSVNAARAGNLRESNPELFGEEPKVKADAPTDDGAAVEAVAAGDADSSDTPAVDDAAGGEGKNKGGDQIPRARLNEVVAKEKNTAAERDALRARLEEIETAQRLAAEEAARQPERDIDAEIEAVIKQYDDGDIDDAEKRALLKPLERDLRQQGIDKAVAVALAEVEKRNGERTAQTEAEQWAAATTRFSADPANEVYQTPIRIAALNEALKEVSAEHQGKIGYDELLKEARDRVEVAFGGKPSSTTETTQQRVTRERREAAARAAAEASSLPAMPSGGVGARGSDGTRDVENISRAEWRKLTQAQRDEMLGKTPASA